MAQRYTKKEKNMFFAGALLGIASGVVGDILVSSMYRIVDKNYTAPTILTFLIAIVFFLWLCFYLLSKIKK